MTNAILFPYASMESVELEIINIYHIIQVLDGDADEIPLNHGYSLFFNPLAGEEQFKMQSQYGIPGNFLICRPKSFGEFEEISVEQIVYIKENMKEVIKDGEV